jgi:hypothetical protein
MEQTMVTCKDCNGVGLVSTGAEPLNLNHGNKVVCKACRGTGKVAEGSSSAASVDSESPKEEGATAQDTGATSGEPSPVAPKIGDPCEMDDGSAGVLGKTEKGNWVCVPTPPQE